MVGVYSGAVAACEGERMVVEGVERGREMLLLSEGGEQVGRHRFHENHHHVGFPLACLHAYIAAHHVHAVHAARDAERSAGGSHSLGFWHEMQLAVLLAHIVERTGEQVECRIDAQLVEERVVAIVCLTYLYRVVTRPAAYAEEAERTIATVATERRATGSGRFPSAGHASMRRSK